MAGILDEVQRVHHDAADIRPVGRKDGYQRTQMEQYIKEHMPLLGVLEVENVLQHRQMAGAGDGQKLRHTLNKTKKDRSTNAHKRSLLLAIFNL